MTATAPATRRAPTTNVTQGAYLTSFTRSAGGTWRLIRLDAQTFLEATGRRGSMDDKDMTARTLSMPSRGNRRRSAAIAAVVTVAALLLGGCDGGTSPQEPYQPSIGGNSGGNFYDDGYSYDDGGINPDRFDPKPPQGPFSP